ncbi:hypothetical protein UFOVP1290_364 [uncultured Caudovirales phage]|uniref:Uncharacterized protein n=1 Tax=uncultured Caudovirales phage TaxID=2100421 RepID=A0A6J5RXT2_9CAUD|nr:hypothetical protein UFOVP1290_364 [uncultured Caudovirales phage]
MLHPHVKIPPDKEFVKFCNSLRCPLCGSQLDGNIAFKHASLYCCESNVEYTSIWKPGISDPESENLQYNFSQYRYDIYIVRLMNDKYSTKIHRYNLDVSPKYISTTRKEVFNYEGPRILFFRKRMSEQEFLKKLKTYTIFS